MDTALLLAVAGGDCDTREEWRDGTGETDGRAYVLVGVESCLWLDAVIRCLFSTRHIRHQLLCRLLFPTLILQLYYTHLITRHSSLHLSAPDHTWKKLRTIPEQYRDGPCIHRKLSSSQCSADALSAFNQSRCLGSTIPRVETLISATHPAVWSPPLIALSHAGQDRHLPASLARRLAKRVGFLLSACPHLLHWEIAAAAAFQTITSRRARLHLASMRPQHPDRVHALPGSAPVHGPYRFSHGTVCKVGASSGQLLGGYPCGMTT